MRYMIHACPDRMWYVNEFLIPSMIEQGISKKEIRVWNDEKKKGNLISCMESFRWCGKHPAGGTWHIQDDVLLSRHFASVTREKDEGVVYGFANEYFRDNIHIYGRVYPPDMWHSFQCVRIPDEIAGECAAWFFAGGWEEDPELLPFVKIGNGDDSCFHSFFVRYHGRETAHNFKPNIVEHVDLLVGGSVANQWRGFWARAAWWDEEELVEELKERLKARNR